MITNEQYEQYKKMIWKQALKHHHVTGIPVEELVSQGNLIFCEAALEWDGDKSSFSTWLTLKLWQGLARFCRTWQLWAAVTRQRGEKLYAYRRRNNGRRTKYVYRKGEIIYCDDLTQEEYDNMPEYPVQATFEADLNFSQWKSTLSDRAQFVVNTLTGFPAETANIINGSCVKIRHSLVEHLRRQQGWHKTEIDRTFSEIRSRLKEL